jgi:hypothetical protein
VKDRQKQWTGSVAFVGRSLVQDVRALLGFRGKGRDVEEGRERYQLRESVARYKAFFEAENDDIALENTYLWDIKPV